MSYDEDLAGRIRQQLASRADVRERRMFGGLAFLVDGRLAIAASHEGGLLLRVDPAASERLLEDPHVTPFVMRGRELAGWLRVEAEAAASEEALAGWVARALREV